MIEYPVFIRFEGEQLAAIITVPDAEPKSLVMFLQGLGAPRSHRYGVWMRTARRLAEHQIASVRLDYPQLGDSTGVFKAEMETPPVGEAKAALAVAREAMGVQKYGVIGNCMGLLAGFELAIEDPDCVSVACFLKDPPKEILVDHGTPNYQRKAKVVSRRIPRVRRFVTRFVHAKKGSFRHGLTPQVARTLRSSDVLFLLTGREETGRSLGRNVRALSAELSAKGPVGTAEVVTIPAFGTDQFQLPLTTHPQVVDAFVRWMCETLPSGPTTSPAPAPLGAAAEFPEGTTDVQLRTVT